MNSTSVNAPTNIKAKELDVNAKLQLYGIFTAFSNGKVPSNKQIDVAINSCLKSKPFASPSKKLSPEGHKLVGDLRDVIEQAKMLVLVKNQGNLLQDFIWQSQHLSGGDFKSPNAPVDKNTAQQHGNDALGGLRALGTLIISNGQFRKLLDDALILFRDMAGDAATNAANRVNPSEDQLRQIDEPAADNTWHDVPNTKDMKSQFNDKYGHAFNKDKAKKVADDSANQGQTQDGRVDATAGAKNAANQISANIPEEDKQKAKQKRDELNHKSRNYINQKIPQERRERTIWRLKKMVVEIQGHQDYLQAVETLLRLAEMYGAHGKNMGAQGQGAVKGAHTDDSLNKAEADLRTLIERFANGTSLDDTFESIQAIYAAAERDPELKGWFRNLNAYVRKCLKQQGYIMEDSAKDEWDRLYDQGRYLLKDKYKQHTNKAIDNIKFVGGQFDEDRQNKVFAESIRKLFLDLGQDEHGNPQFKPHLLKDFSEVILPGVFEHIRYVPIPRIEYSDPQFDVVVENLVIESDNLAPNVLEFGSDNYWRWGRKSITNKNKNKVMLAVSGVQCDLRDVSFYIKRKQGFPSITDKGVFDLFMGGTGFSFKVAMETADPGDKTHFFKIDRVDVDVKNLNIKLKQSKYKMLFTVFKPLLFKVVRPAIQKVLEKQIKDTAHQFDGQMYRIYQEANKAKESAKRNPDPDHVKNIYQHYLDAAKKEMMQGKQKKQEVQKDTQVNMAMTQHESIFKDISLPKGISTKATEYKNMAAQGDRWESPVFSIGSASETSSVPRPPQAARKTAPTSAPHQSTHGTSGFGNEVSRAFDGNNDKINGTHGTTMGHGTHGTGLNQGTHGTTMGQGTHGTGVGQPTHGTGVNQPTHHTTLGQNNPVLQGLMPQGQSNTVQGY